MVEYVSGNILEADVQAVVNTVNTVGVMGKGIALQFKKAYPSMFAAYEKACEGELVKIGKMHVYDRGSLLNPRYIINFPTKKHWKGKSKLADIRLGLEDLNKQIVKLGIESIAIPPLGCGHGGLNWSEVRPLIEDAFATLNVRTIVYPPSGAPAPENIVNRTERPSLTPVRATVIRILAQYCLLGYELTLLEAQKLLYFAQAAGELLSLHFAKGTYGPYADNLRHVLHRFEGHFIVGFGDGNNSPKTPLRLVPEAVAEAERVASGQDELSVTTERFQRISELIEGFESPYGLELLASVHWVATHPAGTASDLDSVIQGVHSWNDRKARVMKPEHIKVAWHRLASQNWIPTQKQALLASG